MKYYVDSGKLDKKDKEAYLAINKFIFTKLTKYEEIKDREWLIGYQTFGLMLVGFCIWIHEMKEQNNIDNLFFLARDGYIVKKVYNILYPNEKTKYFYISRRSLALVSIEDYNNVSNILENLVLPPIFNIKVLFEALNIDYNDNDIKAKLQIVNINDNEMFKRLDYKNDERIILLIDSIKDLIKKKVIEQQNNFYEYVIQENFEGKVGIIDIGWHNSMQKALLRILNRRKGNTSIKGFYLGVYDDANRFDKQNEAFGYLYSYGNNLNIQYQTFSFVSLLETMFLAHEGTTIGYKKETNKIKPQLAEYEYYNEINSLKIVNNFQDGAMQFVKDFNENRELKKIELNSEICSRNILMFGCKTVKSDIKIFEAISFENYEKNNIVNFNKSTWFYLTHPTKVIQDFYKSGWRITFLKKLLIIPLPYNYIFKIICNLFDRR